MTTRPIDGVRRIIPLVQAPEVRPKRPMRRVEFTLDVGKVPRAKADLEWCDFPANVTLVLDGEDAIKLLARLARDIEIMAHGDAPYEVKVSGRAYMSGRLPDKATFKTSGEPCPGVVIGDDVHRWQGRTDPT